MSECKWFNPEIFMCCVVKGELTYCERDGCTKFEPTKKCQSCLKEHDRKLKKALEKWGILENEFDFGADNEFKKQWDQFWKERGIE